MRVRESPQLAHKEGLDNKTGLDKHIKSLIVSRHVDGIYLLLFEKEDGNNLQFSSLQRISPCKLRPKTQSQRLVRKLQTSLSTFDANVGKLSSTPAD
jgi:hypothetical protein